MCFYICSVAFFMIIKYATRDRITVIHVAGCRAAADALQVLSHLRPSCSFSLKNVAARLDSTRSVSLCQAINKYLKECDRPARSPFCGFVVSDNYQTFRRFSLCAIDKQEINLFNAQANNFKLTIKLQGKVTFIQTLAV